MNMIYETIISILLYMPEMKSTEENMAAVYFRRYKNGVRHN